MSTLAEVFATRAGGYWGREQGTAEVDAFAVRNGDVGTTGQIRWSSLPERGYTQREFGKAQVRAGDILLTSSGNCGNSAFIQREPSKPTVATNFVRLLRVDQSKADARYAFHFVRSGHFFAGIAPHIRGATIKNLSVEAAFSEIEIPLPPIAEQRRIAAILDRADAVRVKRRQVLASLDSLTLEMFHDLFGSMKYPRQRLDEFVDSDDRMNYGVVQPGDSVDGGVPLIRVSDLLDGSVSRLSLKRIAPSVERSYSRSRIRGIEILVSSVGSIGAVAVTSPADIGSNIARAITRVPISNPVTRAYVAAFLRTADAQRYFRSEARVVAQPTLNVKQLAATPVPVPAFDQMRTFTEAEARVSAHRAAIQTALAADDELFASLQSRAFRGEL